jgi:hypothetical protein
MAEKKSGRKGGGGNEQKSHTGDSQKLVGCCCSLAELVSYPNVTRGNEQ